MPSLEKVSGIDPELDADFFYDYETLRVGGLIFAGVVVFLSFFLLVGNKIRRCGKPKPKPILEDDD
uniref:FXYD domain-containing ion transport regulator n=1 Tax=Oryzias dancena TaxID=291360 RepID=R4N338_ORYDN|nr:FXYD domain-containing ion transport regulator 12 [Oryzias dancena]